MAVAAAVAAAAMSRARAKIRAKTRANTSSKTTARTWLLAGEQPTTGKGKNAGSRLAGSGRRASAA